MDDIIHPQKVQISIENELFTSRYRCKGEEVAYEAVVNDRE
jgi:hypothetical protein